MTSDARRPGARSPVVTDQQAITLTESENDGTRCLLTVDPSEVLVLEAELDQVVADRREVER